MSTATHALDPALAPEDVLAQLPAGARRLLDVVSTLYGGSWDACAEDVRRRQAGKPYLYRIDLPDLDVLPWLHRLQTYEIARGEPLAVPSLETAENRP